MFAVPAVNTMIEKLPTAKKPRNFCSLGPGDLIKVFMIISNFEVR